MTEQNSYYNNAKTRTSVALTKPGGPEERTIATLMNTCNALATRYRNDSVMVQAVEHVGAAIIVLLNDDTGRIDQGIADQMVRDIVESAGGDPDAL